MINDSSNAMSIGIDGACEIDLAELLGRTPVPLQVAAAHVLLRKRTILVTGAAGSIGSELCRQLLDYEPTLIIGLDTNETGLFDLAESLRAHPHGHCFLPYIGDITHKACIERLLKKERPHIVFHVAAYKHVPLLEQYPDQAIHTNVLGTYYLCCLAQKHEVGNFVFVSTDKAVDPTSVMGATKHFGEVLIRSLANAKEIKTCFSAVRFGNVIGSRGSVVQTFARQISSGGPITITDPQATRYFMTIPEACGLVILSSGLAEAGNIYLLDMGQPVRIVDLALRMVHLSGSEVHHSIGIVYIGLRPGERLHEVLVAVNEELHSTPHSKIFCITCQDAVPSLSTMAQWVRALEDSLFHENDEQLRQCIFEFVYKSSLLVVR
jgi:FlaA1/EpsC-like NDP-sugar epimerase